MTKRIISESLLDVAKDFGYIFSIRQSDNWLMVNNVEMTDIKFSEIACKFWDAGYTNFRNKLKREISKFHRG